MATAVVDSPIGPLALTATDAGLARVDFGPVPALADPGGGAAAEAHLVQVAEELDEYFTARRTVFTAALDRSNRKGFRAEVLAVLEGVPYGEVITYGELAAEAGRPGAARAVGTAMASNPLPILVPCHRVTRSGSVGSYGGGMATKLQLLRMEGALPVR